MSDLLQKFNVSSVPALFFRMTHPSNLLRNSLVLAFSLLLMGIQTVSAQTGSNIARGDDQVDAMLADIQSQLETREVYNSINGFKVADVPVSSLFKVVESRGDWRIVRFNSRLIAAWVSADYVELANGAATVNASTLNVRLSPQLSAKIITTVPRGYQAQVREQRDGFVKLLLPSGQQFAIRNEATGVASVVDTPTLDNSATAQASQQVTKAPSQNAAQKKNETPSETATLTATNEGLHKISPGDAISLVVFGERDLSSTNVRVPQSGRVSFPLIGSVVVVGKTTAEVEDSVSELLAQGYVRNPRLSVTMFSYRPIFIRGAVRQTGSYPFTEGLTIAKAIALAGGSKNSAKVSGVSVSRDGQIVADGLSIDSEVEIASGDVISIGEEIGVSEDAASYIYLHGEVPSPGEYLYRRGLTVEKAIVLAGGFTIRASRKKISVTRYAEQDENGKPKRLKRVKLYEPIEPGDVIVVGASWF